MLSTFKQQSSKQLVNAVASVGKNILRAIVCDVVSYTWYLSEVDQEGVLLLSIAHYRQFSYHVRGIYISPDCLTARYFGESDKGIFRSYAAFSFLLKR